MSSCALPRSGALAQALNLLFQHLIARLDLPPVLQAATPAMISFRLRAISTSLLCGIQAFQMLGKPEIRFCDELPVEPLLGFQPDLSPATSTIARRSGSKAKAARHSPSAASNRSSFILACFDL